MSYMRPHIASPIFAGSDAFVELRPPQQCLTELLADPGGEPKAAQKENPFTMNIFVCCVTLKDRHASLQASSFFR